jgi:hypothetical protein
LYASPFCLFARRKKERPARERPASMNFRRKRRGRDPASKIAIGERVPDYTRFGVDYQHIVTVNAWVRRRYKTQSARRT